MSLLRIFICLKVYILFMSIWILFLEVSKLRSLVIGGLGFQKYINFKNNWVFNANFFENVIYINKINLNYKII